MWFIFARTASPGSGFFAAPAVAPATASAASTTGAATTTHLMGLLLLLSGGTRERTPTRGAESTGREELPKHVQASDQREDDHGGGRTRESHDRVAVDRRARQQDREMPRTIDEAGP